MLLHIVENNISSSTQSKSRNVRQDNKKISYADMVKKNISLSLTKTKNNTEGKKERISDAHSFQLISTAVLLCSPPVEKPHLPPYRASYGGTFLFPA